MKAVKCPNLPCLKEIIFQRTRGKNEMQTIERSVDGIDLRILNVSGRDLIRAAPDAISTNIGAGPAAPHPLADDLYDVNLATIAAHFGGLVNTGNPAHGVKALQTGLSSYEFKTILEKTGRRVIEKTYERDDTLNRICRPLPQDDLKANIISDITIDTDLDEMNEGGEKPLLMGKVSDRQTNRMKSWGLAILVQRRDIVNNDQALIARLFAEAGQLAQRHEIKRVISYLESNPTLPELDSKRGSDRPWFTADDGNLVAGSADAAGLDAGLQALRNQKAANGDAENIKGRYILAPGSDEYTLSKAVHESGLDLDVIVHPNISADHFYILADPARQPAIGVQFLGPADAREVRTWILSQVRKMPVQYDGIGYTLDVDLAPMAISRKGIVKVASTL
jgi:hypothetical protein